MDTIVWIQTEINMEWLTTKELAAKLRLAPSTVNKYCSSEPDRLPPFHKLNGKRLWIPAEVDSWISSRLGQAEERRYCNE